MRGRRIRVLLSCYHTGELPFLWRGVGKGDFPFGKALESSFLNNERREFCKRDLGLEGDFPPFQHSNPANLRTQTYKCISGRCFSPPDDNVCEPKRFSWVCVIFGWRSRSDDRKYADAYPVVTDEIWEDINSRKGAWKGGRNYDDASPFFFLRYLDVTRTRLNLPINHRANKRSGWVRVWEIRPCPLANFVSIFLTVHFIWHTSKQSWG